MDITNIDPRETNQDVGILIGDSNVTKTTLEFLNLRCPYCRQWFEETQDLLAEAVARKEVKRLIKLLDKEKPSLQPGNIMHRYVTKGDGEQAVTDITKIFASQDQWGDLPLDEVAEYAEEVLNLTNQQDGLTQQAIVDEAQRANIQFVPTIILEEHIFDENIQLDTLASYLQN